MNWGFLQSWNHLGHNSVFSTWHCSFYQQELKSCTDIPKHITSDSLYILANKYYATVGRQLRVNKLARKRFFIQKTAPKTDRDQKNNPLIIIPCECWVVYKAIISSRDTTPQVGIVNRKVPSFAGTPKKSRQPFEEAFVYRSGSYILQQLSSYRGSSHGCILCHHVI